MTALNDKEQAKDLIKDFADGEYPKAFLKLHRHQVASGLLQRVDRPWLIKQGKSTLCVPASIVYDVAHHRPVEYVKLVTDLFESGKAKLGKWTLEPCYDLRHYAFEANKTFAEADWIPLASLRDCENWFLDYESVADDGWTSVHDTLDMLRKAGYRHIVNATRRDDCQTVENLQGADYHYQHDYTVCLRIDNALLHNTDPQGHANHRVVLVSPVMFGPSDTLYLRIFSNGQIHDIPRHGTMKISRFLRYHHGFIACKY